MKIDPGSLEELRRICAESFQKNLSDFELQDVGQRIVRFLLNSDADEPADLGQVDPD
jgi:hypothetical protein